MKEYFRRFSDQVPKVKQASEETLKNFLIASFQPEIDFWKELQGKDPETQADFYAKAESSKVVEDHCEFVPGT